MLFFPQCYKQAQNFAHLKMIKDALNTHSDLKNLNQLSDITASIKFSTELQSHFRKVHSEDKSLPKIVLAVAF